MQGWFRNGLAPQEPSPLATLTKAVCAPIRPLKTTKNPEQANLLRAGFNKGTCLLNVFDHQAHGVAGLAALFAQADVQATDGTGQ